MSPSTDTRRITHVHQPAPHPEAITVRPHVQQLHSYRVPYQPEGFTPDCRMWPAIRVRATDAEDAQRKAAHTTGRPVADAERIED